MTLLTVVFDSAEPLGYHRLHRVWEHTERETMPGANVVTLHLDPPAELTTRRRQGEPAIHANHHRLRACDRYIQTHHDDIIMTDCDMLFLGDLSTAFDDYDFDIALTYRDTPGSRIPINGGVVMVRNTAAAREFIGLWRESDDYLFEHRKRLLKWTPIHKGINQSSLARVLSREEYSANIAYLPCSRYNACDQDWQYIETNPPLCVHIKSALRNVVLSGKAINRMKPSLRAAARAWRDANAAAG